MAGGNLAAHNIILKRHQVADRFLGQLRQVEVIGNVALQPLNQAGQTGLQDGLIVAGLEAVPGKEWGGNVQSQFDILATVPPKNLEFLISSKKLVSKK